ncbi:MAG: hypothetical protein AAGG56_13375 [Pseudomonadota bacterium]
MPSTTITDYQVLRDGRFTLDSGLNDVETLTFAVPDDLHLSTSGARKAVLMFKLEPQLDSQVTVRLHGGLILSNMSFPESVRHAHHETFDIAALLTPLSSVPAQGAEVLFNVPSGRVQFSDIVIWYQINR